MTISINKSIITHIYICFAIMINRGMKYVSLILKKKKQWELLLIKKP